MRRAGTNKRWPRPVRRIRPSIFRYSRFRGNDAIKHGSREQPVHVPSRVLSFGPEKTVTKNPEAAAAFVLYPIIVARQAFTGFESPPERRDPLRPFMAFDVVKIAP